MEQETPVKSVRKAMDLLDQIVAESLRGGDSSLSELAGRLGVPGNSARNLLKTLVDCGYVAQVGRGVYGPGAKVRQLGLMNRLDVPATRQAVRAVLGRFAERTGETCLLAVLVRGQRVVVAQVDSTHVVAVSQASVNDRPFFSLPTGRMLAALADESQRREILEHHGRPGDDWPEAKGKAALTTELDALGRQGCCTVVESQRGLVSQVQAVPGADAAMPAVVATFAPLFRCDEAQQKQLAEALTATAEEMSPLLAGA